MGEAGRASGLHEKEPCHEHLAPVVIVSPLRQRLIDEMEVRRFGRDTQRNYRRDVGRFATWLGRSPDTATAEELRRFQVERRDLGVTAPTMNSIVAALRFFFTHALDRSELARLLDATTCLKHQAALSSPMVLVCARPKPAGYPRV